MIKRLRKKRGAVALEALISLALLLLVTIISWNIARHIYEASIINSAANLAAQATIQYYDRRAPANCSENQTACQAYLGDAVSSGQEVFRSNYCTPGRLPSLGIAGSDPCSASGNLIDISLSCGKRPPNRTEPISFLNSCEGAGEEESKVIRAEVKNPVFDTDLTIFPGANLQMEIGQAAAYAWRVG